MPIQLSWDNPNETVILWEMLNPLTTEDFFAAQDQTFEMGGKNADLDIIVHLAKDLKVPAGFLSTLGVSENRSRRLAEQYENQPDLETLIVIVGNSISANMLLDLFLKLNPSVNWRKAATTEEAREMIAAYRASHPQ